MTPRPSLFRSLFSAGPDDDASVRVMVVMRRQLGNAVRARAQTDIVYFAEGLAFYATGPDSFDGPIADVISMRRPCYGVVDGILEAAQCFAALRSFNRKYRRMARRSTRRR